MNKTRPDGESGGQDRHEQLSALMDGELDAEAAAGCCALWREQDEARADWHLYHLIGDVLRADSRHVNCDPGRDARMLHALRQRLAVEPPVHVVAEPPRRRVADGASKGRAQRPFRGVVAQRWRSGWLAGAGAAAAFTVAGAFLVIGPGAPGRQAPAADRMVAAAPQPAVSPLAEPGLEAQGRDPRLVRVASPEAPMSPAAVPDDVQLIRDARLDQYLAAHTQFGGSSALGVPSGFLRSATLQAPAR